MGLVDLRSEETFFNSKIMWTKALLLRTSWQDFCAYMSLYGPQIFLVTCLSAVTLYRREMSCNRVFHVEPDCDETKSQSSSSSEQDNLMELDTEDLLDGAGLYCSGAPLVAFASVWIDCVAQSLGEDDNNKKEVTESTNLWDETATPEDLLDQVGNFCSGAPFWFAASFFLLHRSEPSSRLSQNTQQHHDPFSQDLPPDVHVHIASFLHPKDVVTLACVGRSYRNIVDRGETARAIWKTLWERDYGWILHSWDVGQQALQRSQSTPCFGKDFYFTFGLSYLNYVLAGNNTTERCFVGLHSNIYDITLFLDTHPGSPDTLMVHSGRDATAFFEDMGHSLRARRLAKSLCVVVDQSDNDGGCGLRPTVNTMACGGPLPSPVETDRLLLGRRKTQQRRPGTLKRIQTKFTKEQEQVKLRVARRFEWDPRVVGKANAYYDPICQEWRAWFTSNNFEPVFVQDI
jgi:hypothetical protein